ncbi:helix-turn-helix domain-containing protein [Bacillus salitolerans]|uniref:Helix-turn-helix domain-containing protein n=1 Tax=Bacillus salitolerans TaxID=1437434 RepID=A0ABW4LXT0_9BACI
MLTNTFTDQELASMIGTTRETINRTTIYKQRRLST